MLRRDFLKKSGIFFGATLSPSISIALQENKVLSTATSKDKLTRKQKKSIEILSGLIIPSTDTPGAIEADVPAFIYQIINNWYNEKEAKIFLEGLNKLDTFCKKTSGTFFYASSEEVKNAALNQAEKAFYEYKSPPPPDNPLDHFYDENIPFYGKLKELVIVGYYTSEVGVKQELVYLPAPGFYDGNYEYSKHKRRFAS